jgi:putative hydrolase of the HAD superfamily
VSLTAVVFDFYGTLTRGRSATEQAAARLAQASALGVDPVAFDAELTATVDARFRGAGGDVRGELAWVAERLGVICDPERLDAAAEVRLECERAFGEPRPDAVAVLAALHERDLKIGVISDCSAELPRYFSSLSVAPHVDAAVFSFVTGARKPEPANYLSCCGALEVAPRDCLYVGDGGSDELAGARAVGMRPVHLNVPAEHNTVIYGRHATWDGESINQLGEVLDLLSMAGPAE